MAELPANSLEIAVEVGQIAAASGSIEDRAAALLEPLSRIVPFRAARIHLLDMERRKQLPLVSRGYDEAVTEYMNSPAFVEEIEMLGLNRVRAPMRVRDLPVPPEQVRGWAEYLQPAGFREGLAVGLFTPDNRFLGVLGLNTDTDRHPTVGARDLIGLLAPVIASAVDPLRSIAEASRIVGGAHAGVMLTDTAATMPLPGLPGHPLLAVGSDVLRAAADRVAMGRVYSSFLTPLQAERPAGHVRITLLTCPPRPPHNLTAVVLVSPPGDLRGLTPRELEILGLLVDGWSNQRVATALFITERTVATHVEHILAKLAAPSRTLAAVRAFWHGLYVPRPLNGVRED